MHERLSDKTASITMLDLLTHMGTATEAFESLEKYLTTELSATEKGVYFDVHDKGWAIRYYSKRLSKKTYICNIVAEKDSFLFVTSLSEGNIQKAYKTISDYAKECAEQSPYRHRGWLEYQATGIENLEDIKTLLQLRVSGNQKSIG